MNAISDKELGLVKDELASLAPHKSITLKRLLAVVIVRFEKANLGALTEARLKKILENLRYRVAIRRGVERVYFAKQIPEPKVKVVKEKAPKTTIPAVTDGKPAAPAPETKSSDGKK